MSIQRINEPRGNTNDSVKPTPNPSKLDAAVIEMLVSAINGYLETVQANHDAIIAQDLDNERDIRELSRAEAIESEAIADNKESNGSGKVSAAGVSVASATPTASASAASAGAAIAITGA